MENIETMRVHLFASFIAQPNGWFATLSTGIGEISLVAVHQKRLVSNTGHHPVPFFFNHQQKRLSDYDNHRIQGLFSVYI